MRVIIFSIISYFIILSACTKPDQQIAPCDNVIENLKGEWYCEGYSNGWLCYIIEEEFITIDNEYVFEGYGDARSSQFKYRYRLNEDCNELEIDYKGYWPIVKLSSKELHLDGGDGCIFYYKRPDANICSEQKNRMIGIWILDGADDQSCLIPPNPFNNNLVYKIEITDHTWKETDGEGESLGKANYQIRPSCNFIDVHGWIDDLEIVSINNSMMELRIPQLGGSCVFKYRKK